MSSRFLQQPVACRDHSPKGQLRYCWVQLNGEHKQGPDCRCEFDPENCPVDVHRIRYHAAHPMFGDEISRNPLRNRPDMPARPIAELRRRHHGGLR